MEREREMFGKPPYPLGSRGRIEYDCGSIKIAQLDAKYKCISFWRQSNGMEELSKLPEKNA